MAENGKKLWCWIKKRLIAAGIVAGTLTAVSAAIVTLSPYRFWASAEDFRTVAGRVYEVTIPEQLRVVGSVKRRLERAKAVPPVHRDSKDDKKINDLEIDLEKEKLNLSKQIDERARLTK